MSSSIRLVFLLRNLKKTKNTHTYVTIDIKTNKYMEQKYKDQSGLENV